ncbi:MAG: glycosyltransferase, partial [Burkholderiaceae bacterium]
MDSLEKFIGLVKASGLFDSDWYMAQYPDVAATGLDPVEHYLRIGAPMLRDPSPGFSTRFYLNSNPDVAAARVDPLSHYIIHGRAEGRAPLPAPPLPPEPLSSLLSTDSGRSSTLSAPSAVPPGAGTSLAPAAAAVAAAAEPPRMLPVPEQTAIDVVIPVFNALDDVQRCLDSVRRRSDGYRVTAIVVNDGSDAPTSDWLRHYCGRHEEFELIEHERNRGYTQAVNTGLKRSSAPYVVTLNSDTIVTRGWLNGLVRCMETAAQGRAGIVGPMSNAASWQNVPELFDDDDAFAVNPLPADLTPDAMAGLISSISRRQYPPVPFVNGFCFMIRRQVIDAIGYMDEEAFPLGYGEENDFCIRAADAGFALAIADDCYVFHAKSKSFGHERRKALSQQGSETLRRKHGATRLRALTRQMREIEALDRLRTLLKNRLAKRRADGDGVDLMSMRILFLLPARGGGGGANSVVQEVTEMRLLGLSASIAVKQRDLAHIRDVYADVRDPGDLFIGFGDDTLLSLSEDYDIVVGTVYHSMALVQQIVAVHPHILPAYYVQDYEPMFFTPDSEQWAVARASYTLVPGTLLFAKTHWIAQQVLAEHGVAVSKVAPSIDHDVYRPGRRLADGIVRVAAMIRPQTPVRGAARTMRVLARLVAAHGARVEVHVFGCAEDAPQFQALQRGFPYRNHGVLKRPQVAALLAQADVFIDLSDYQAFGRTGLEAMACGCAVMVPVHGGTDEYAVDGVNAMVIDSLDEAACLARLNELLSSDEQLRTMQRAGLLTASRYSARSAAVSEIVLFAGGLETHRRTHPRPQKSRLSLVPSRRLDGVPTGSGHVRVLLPFDSTAIRQGWRVDTCPAGELPVPGESDVALLQREVAGFSIVQLDEWLDAWRSTGGRFIYEIDDDLFDPAALRARDFDGDAEQAARKAQWLICRADAVSVSTDALAQRIRPLNPNVHVVPNCLDARLWKLHGDRRPPPAPAHARQPGGPLRIGYIGTPTHGQDLALVAEAMNRIQTEYGGRVQIEVIGAFQRQEPLFGVRVPLPRSSDYPNFVRWLHQRVHWDIGIIPLL